MGVKIMENKKSDFNEDLIKLLSEVRNVAKNKKGYGYTYADLGSILEYIKPILSKHNFCIYQLVGSTHHEKGEYLVNIKTTLQHIGDRQISNTFAIPPTPVKGANILQSIGASITYARRYAISAILNIATEDDPDGNMPIKRKQQSVVKGKQIGTADLAVNIIDGASTSDYAKKELNKYAWTKELTEYAKELLTKKWG